MRIARVHGFSRLSSFFLVKLTSLRQMTNSTKKLKSDLRQQALKQRYIIQKQDHDLSQLIETFFEHASPHPDDIIAAYWPIRGELDLTPLIQKLTSQGFQCALPIVVEDTLQLEFAIWNDETIFKKGQYGISEPATAERISPDIFLIPMLAFDMQGYRLGYGGGYYDKTIAYYQCSKHVTTIGVAFEEQKSLLPLPREDHDIPLDMILTQQKLYNFKS